MTKILLDSHGTPIKRAIGFISGYVIARKALPLIGALSVVGFEVPLIEDDDDCLFSAPTFYRIKR